MRIAVAVVVNLWLVNIANAARPLPEKAKLDAAKLVARDRYFNELKKGDADELKTFLDAADATTDDDARQAALYLVIADAAAESGNLRLAFEALDRLGQHFDYNVPAGKIKLLEAAIKTAKGTETRLALVNRLLEVVEEAADEGRFETAEQAAKLAESIAVKLRDAKLRKELAAKRAKVETRRREDAAEAGALAKAQAVLKTDPNDSEANRVVGVHLATIDHWNEALEHLARADDEELRAAATADATRPDAPDKQLALADDWWQLADGLENVKQRAALPALRDLLVFASGTGSEGPAAGAGEPTY